MPLKQPKLDGVVESGICSNTFKNKKESSKLEGENERLQEENKKLTREKEEQDRRDTFKYCRQCSINGNENLDEPLNDEIKSQ